MKQEKKKLLKANHRILPANNPLLSKLKIMSQSCPASTKINCSPRFLCQEISRAEIRNIPGDLKTKAFNSFSAEQLVSSNGQRNHRRHGAMTLLLHSPAPGLIKSLSLMSRLQYFKNYSNNSSQNLRSLKEIC